MRCGGWREASCSEEPVSGQREGRRSCRWVACHDELHAGDVSLVVDVDFLGAGDFREAGHEHHVAGDSNEKTGAGGKRHVGDVEGPAVGRAELLRIVGEGVLGFGDAHGQAGVAPVHKFLEFGAGCVAEGDAVGAVDLRRDFVELDFVAVGERVDGVRCGAGVANDEVDDGTGEGFRPFAAFGEGLGEGGGDAETVTESAKLGELVRRVVGEAIDGDESRQAEALEVLRMAGEVGEAALEITFTLVAEALDGGDEDGGGWAGAGDAHDDVDVLFGAEVGGKAALIDDVVGEAEADLLSDEARGAVGNVAEGACMDESGRAFGGLDKVREDGVGEEGHHGAGGVEVGGADGLVVAGGANDDGVETAAEVIAIAGEGEDGHDFGSGGDDEAGAAVGSVALAVDFDSDAAQGAVVHVHGARPPDVGGVEVEVVAVEEMRIDEGREEVMRRGDGVDVAGEVEIDFLAGLDLREAAAGGAAFHAEDGAERRFARGDDGFFAEALEALDEADGSDGLAFAGRSGGSGGDEDELAVGRPRGIVEEVEVELGVPGAELIVVGVAEAELMSDAGDGEKRRFGGGHFQSVSHRTFCKGRGSGRCDGPHSGDRCRVGDYTPESREREAIRMKWSWLVVGGAAMALSCGAWGQGADACAGLTSMKIPGVEITKAATVPAGPAEPLPQGWPGYRGQLPAHCRVDGVIHRRKGVDGEEFGIGFALALPDEWNGDFLMQGGGGGNGYIDQPTGATAAGDKPGLVRGFAVASTDTGHKAKTGPFDFSFMRDEQAMLDFAYLANAEVAGVAKEMIAQYYGKPAEHAYFVGCSTGGREGMILSQRYPMVFDGIVSGDPAMDTGFSNLAASRWSVVNWNQIAPKDASGKPITAEAFTDADRKVIREGLLKRCDAKDGVADGMIFDPLDCDFDPKMVECKAGQTEGCLNAEKVAAIERVFAGPKNKDGDNVYPGFLYDTGITYTAPIPGLLAMRGGFLGRAVTETQMDVDKEAETASQPLVDSLSTNLTTFAAHGGKLIFYHGDSDPWFSPLDTLGYYRKMAEANGGLEKVEQWSEIYLVPGMSHCGGGAAALDDFDMLSAVVDWVEKGTAPERVVATGKAFPGRSRPLCAYPKHAQYTGKGSTEDAANFECR